MAKTDNLTDFLTNIADAIRTVEGSTNAINPQDFEAKITALKLSVQTADANATAADILSGKTAWVKGTKISGSIGTKAATTIIPGTSDQTIASGIYLAGDQTIKGDANLIADNIKSGTSIFGITGSYEGSGGGSSVETCTVTFSSNVNTVGGTFAYNRIFLTVFEDNKITTKVISHVNKITVSNVVCNSISILEWSSTLLSTSTSNVTVLDSSTWQAVVTFTGNATYNSTFANSAGGGAT